jgi:hypothetical protein
MTTAASSLDGIKSAARYFRIEKLGCPHILDNKGRTPLLPVIRPTSAEDIERQKNREGATDLALLRVIYEMPFASQAQWAIAIGISQQAISKKLKVLQAKKLVEEGANNRWHLTTKGKREVESAPRDPNP